MKNNKKFVKVVSFVLVVLLIITFIMPAFSMIAFAQTNENDILAKAVNSVSVTADNSQDAYIVDFKVEGNAMLEETNGKTVTISVLDKRVKFNSSTQATDSNVTISLLPCSFTAASNSVKVNSITDGINYTITFTDVKYNGGNQEFSFTANYADEKGQTIPVELKTFTHNVTQVNKEPVTPSISNENMIIDGSKEVFVQNYVILDVNGNELSTVKPGQKIKLAISVVDNRVLYLNNPPSQVRARLSQGSFINNDINNISYKVRDVGTVDNRKILAYSIVFHDVTYNGGSSEASFDVSYIENVGGQEIPLAVPQSTLKLTITQAVDDVPEPKVILNSANYGGVAYVGKEFSLNTTATNTSQFIPLENVSVKVELPAGIAMASGNSQALIGKVDKNGKINHSFELVVTGIDNNVSSLPVKVIYEFEAYVKGERKTYTTQQDVAINVQQETKFDISKLEYMETISAGEESNISVFLINKGKTSVNNVTAEVESSAINGPQTVFVGNVEPGSENTADIYFTIDQPGTASGKVIITYEDSKGVQNKIEKEFSMEVMEAMDSGMDLPIVEPEIVQESGFPWVAVIVSIVVIAGAVGGFIFYKKQKAKKMIEDEDEDI